MARARRHHPAKSRAQRGNNPSQWRLGANVVAVDISDRALELASTLGAVATVNAARVANGVEAVKEITQGGAHVSLDALGHPITCFNSIGNLRRRDRDSLSWPPPVSWPHLSYY